MLFLLKHKETITTGIGSTALTAIAVLLFKNPTQTTLLLVLQLAGAAILLYGLTLGFMRHRDPSPLLFALLGLGGLILLRASNLPPLMPLLGSICFITAGGWSILVTSHNKSTDTNAPGLDEFLDQSLLPSEEKDADQ